MKRRIIKQTGIAALVVLALLISKNSHVGALEDGADAVLNYMSVSYSLDDVKNAADRTRTAAVSANSEIADTVGAIIGKTEFAEPIDEKYTGNQAAVYAVAGGQVTAVGESEEIGKYVRITHGDLGESLYGNLKSVSVTVPSNVKKGQIIGIYEKSDDREFYYSFTEAK